jgi:WD40 repeat protein
VKKLINKIAFNLTLSILLVLCGGVYRYSYGFDLFNSGPLIVRDRISIKSAHSLDWSPDGKYIAIQNDHREVQVFDAQTSKEIITLPIAGQFFGDEKCNVAFSPDGKLLVAGLVDVSIWKVGTWNLKGVIAGPQVDMNNPPASATLRLAIAPDSRHIVVATKSDQHGRKPVIIEKVTMYDLITLNTVWEKYIDESKHQSIYTPIFFTPDGGKIVFAVYKFYPNPAPILRPPKRQSNIVVLDALTGNVIKNMEKVHSDLPKTLALSKDGRYVATATMTGCTDSGMTNHEPIRVWDINSGSLIAELPIEVYPWSLAFSPDGKSMASATGHQLIIFDFKN